MKSSIFCSILISAILLSPVTRADQLDNENAEVAAVVRSIRENGPPQLQRLSSSAIEHSARTFVRGRNSGQISAAQLARMGGVRGATESSLSGQLKVMGAW
jgi:hypothetical protein